MNDTVDNDETGRACLDPEKFQISIAQATQLDDEPPRQLDNGQQFSEVFWANAIKTTLHQTHPRVPTLRTELECEYKFENGRIYVRTKRYKMTTRYGNVYRANINIALNAASYVSRDSPDSMSQDREWHDYEIYLDAALAAPSFNMYLVIQVEYDGTDNGVGSGGGWGVHIRPARKPVIDVPRTGAVMKMPFTVSGKNGLLDGRVNLSCTYNGNAHSLGYASVRTDGSWSTSISLPAGVLTFRAEQVIGSEKSGQSDPVTIKWYVAPIITTPASNAVVARGDPFVLKGRGIIGETVEVMTPGGGHVHTRADVKSDNTWEGLFNQTQFPNGGLIRMQVAHKTRQDWSAEQTFRLLGAPPLTTHSDNQTVEQQITVGGVLADPFKSGTVNVYRDSTTTLLGSSNVLATGGWAAAITLVPGPQRVTASHIYSSVPSERTVSIRLLVRPSKPTLTSRLNGETVTLSGTGHNGAGVRMDIHFNGDFTPYLDSPVNGGSWTKVLPADLLPGNHRFGGRQSVSDGGSGRIYNSGWATETTVNVPTPKPTGVTVTANGQRPTFRGQANQWGAARVEVYIFNNGAQLAGVPAAIVQSNRSWETTANVNLPPGIYPKLTARQRVNSQWSADSAVFTLTVETPIPEFTEPPVGTPVGQRPLIKGNAWPGAQVTLKISGMDDVTVPANGGVFVRNAAEDWPPGTHTIAATATSGGRTSLPATRTFTVKTPLPIITTAANAEVDLSPVITGTGYKNCWVVIHSDVTHLPIGAGLVGPDGKWNVTLADQAPQDLRLYAVQHESQQNSSNPSEPTAARTVKVRVAKPLITIPAQNGKPTRTSEFSGTAKYPGTIELSIKGQPPPFLKDIEVQQNGAWSVKVTLPAGALTVEAKLRQQNYTSEAFERVITVVPATPVIDSPQGGEKLGRVLRMSGFGVKGDTIVIYRRGSVSNTLTRTTVLNDGTWSASVVHNLVEKDGINVLASAGPGLDSALSPVVNYTLLTTEPSLTEPLPSDWVGVRPQYSGLATPGASITVASWFNADDVLAPVATADRFGRWIVVGNKDLPVGAMRVVVRQNGTQWFESARFMVERKVAGFEAPSVHYPLTGQSVGRYPMFSGTGEPGAEVVIAKDGSPTTELGRVRVDRDGRWALRSQIQLPVVATPYSYSVRQSRDGVDSGWLLPTRNLVVTQVTADFEPPVIDEPVDNPDQVLEKRPVLSGRGTPGAQIETYDGFEESGYASRVNAEGRWSVRANFDLQEAPYQVKARQKMDGEFSQWSSTVAFKVGGKPKLFVIDSPQRGAEVSSYAVFRGTGSPGGEVRLYLSADPARIRWRGMVDEAGQWVIVTEPLSVGRYEMEGYLVWSQENSPTLPKFEFYVIDGG